MLRRKSLALANMPPIDWRFWPTVFGAENVPAKPTKPTPFHHSLFVLEGNEKSPVLLLGPLQGDSVDHTLFWLPTERTVICGDAVYARSTHLWVEEVETPQLLDAWFKTLDLIEEGLRPEKVIPGHIEQGWELDAKADLAHARKYLQFFAEKVTYAKKKPGVDELYKTFKDAFPQAGKSLIMYDERYRSALIGLQTRTLTSSSAICRISSAKAGRSGRRTSIIMLVPGRRSSWRRITSLLDEQVVRRCQVILAVVVILFLSPSTIIWISRSKRYVTLK